MIAARHHNAVARQKQGAPIRGTEWGAQVRALLAHTARTDPDRPAVIDALGTVTAQRLYADAVRAARDLTAQSGGESGYRIITGPSDRRFLTATLATLIAGRILVLAPGHAAAHVPGLLAGADGRCRAWKVTLDALGGRLAAFSTCGGPSLGDGDLLAGLGMRPGDGALIAQPLYAALAAEATLRQVLAGGTAILAGPFQPEQWLRLCATLRPQWALCTPTQLGRLLAAPGAQLAAATAHLRTLMIDGQCPAPLRAAALRALPANLVQYYGTPLYHGATASGGELAAAEPAHTVLPGAALRVVDEHERRAQRGRAGSIQARQHSHPIAAACPRPGAVWAGWGERGALRGDRRLLVTDTRVEGRAVIDGVGVALGRVRDTLFRHPAITDVRLVVDADAFGGQQVAAHVSTGEAALTVDALRSWCNGHLDPAERPAELVVTRAAPGDDR